MAYVYIQMNSFDLRCKDVTLILFMCIYVCLHVFV